MLLNNSYCCIREGQVVCRSFVKMKLLTYTSHTLANGTEVRMTPNEDYHNITNFDELISITPEYLQSFIHSFINMDIPNISACMFNVTCIGNFFYDKVRLDSKVSVIVNEVKVLDVSTHDEDQGYKNQFLGLLRKIPRENFQTI